MVIVNCLILSSWVLHLLPNSLGSYNTNKKLTTPCIGTASFFVEGKGTYLVPAAKKAEGRALEKYCRFEKLQCFKADT